MDAGTCTTPGCFKTTYGSELCHKCLEGVLPMQRGPVKVKEAMRARLLGGEDKAVTRRRMIQHGQPTDMLDREPSNEKN